MSTQLGRCVDLLEGGGAADPRFSHVEVPEPHPPSCDVAVGGVHGAVDLPGLHGGALQPVVSGWSRRVALEDLPAGLGWFVGRQSQRARTGWFFCSYLSNYLFDFLQANPEVIVTVGQLCCQVMYALLEASADVPHALNKVHLGVGAGPWRAGWTLQYLTSDTSWFSGWLGS